MINLTQGQQDALRLVREGHNVFLTGQAGTGKSTAIKAILKENKHKVIHVVASTGAAACLISGGARTFHSWASLGIMAGSVSKIIQKACHSEKVGKRVREPDILVIDEVSMLGGEVLDTAEQIVRHHRGGHTPWSDLQLVVTGDFAQLPVIVESGKTRDWAFEHPIWEYSDLKPVMLTECMRTDEPRLLKVLSHVREGLCTWDVTDFVKARSIPCPPDRVCSRLFGHRDSAENYNLDKLRELNTPLYSFNTVYEGTDYGIERLKKCAPMGETLWLRKGAQVMLCRNDQNMRWVNGSLGVVSHLSEKRCEVMLNTGRNVVVEPEEFNYLDGDGRIEATAINYPMILAWACTIHKVQGATLDGVVADLSRLWEPGHVYVAMSRVRSENDFFIDGWSESSVRADPKVQQFYAKIDPRPKPVVTRRARLVCD